LVEKPQRHRIAAEQTVRAGIIERHHGFAAVLSDYCAETLMHDIERCVPADALEAVAAARAGAS
jgi:hypothetical protein